MGCRAPASSRVGVRGEQIDEHSASITFARPPSGRVIVTAWKGRFRPVILGQTSHVPAQNVLVGRVAGQHADGAAMRHDSVPFGRRVAVDETAKEFPSSYSFHAFSNAKRWREPMARLMVRVTRPYCWTAQASTPHAGHVSAGSRWSWNTCAPQPGHSTTRPAWFRTTRTAAVCSQPLQPQVERPSLNAVLLNER